MARMQIFEPAMCCPTGLCGVAVDPELLRVATALDALKKRGVVVERFNLNSAPMEFVKNTAANRYLEEKGPQGLPLVLVDGEIVLEGRYPTAQELERLLELPQGTAAPAVIKVPRRSKGGCGCQGGRC